MRPSGPKIDADKITELHLAGRHQIRERKHQMAFDGALQVPGAIFRVRAFVQQEALNFRRAVENELVGAGGEQNSLLHHAQFDFENLFQML